MIFDDPSGSKLVRSQMSSGSRLMMTVQDWGISMGPQELGNSETRGRKPPIMGAFPSWFSRKNQVRYTEMGKKGPTSRLRLRVFQPHAGGMMNSSVLILHHHRHWLSPPPPPPPDPLSQRLAD